VVYFVQFVNQQYARLFVFKSGQQRAGDEELPAMQLDLQRRPVDIPALGLQVHAKSLQWLIELPDGFFLVDAFITLQSFHSCSCGLCQGISDLSFAAARRALQQERFLQSRSEENRRYCNRICDVADRAKPFSEFSGR